MIFLSCSGSREDAAKIKSAALSKDQEQPFIRGNSVSVTSLVWDTLYTPATSFGERTVICQPSPRSVRGIPRFPFYANDRVPRVPGDQRRETSWIAGKRGQGQCRPFNPALFQRIVGVCV
ncbi:hypothetical protein JTE90_028426 [Oedothorax gibbosus]|uniref:Uncharacterized protein n=1 Tax=Oedothorax gibbosus TaxID=931172 RepID=A0AAV6VH22_9ARAC|nr:hypothetical protein JTE90_028426 [Oedothorax gibbosus]